MQKRPVKIRVFRCGDCHGYYVASEDGDGFHRKDKYCPHAETRRVAIEMAMEYEECHGYDPESDDVRDYMLELEKMLEDELDDDE